MSTPNRYPGTCLACGKTVPAGAGTLERKSGRRRGWQVRCQTCATQADHSSAEDACCGDRAYEDACARACGMEGY